MTPICIESIPHREQPYDTVGDYFSRPGVGIIIHVSAMPNEQFERLVALHELVEKILTDAHGISDAAVDAFDRAYEAKRQPGDDSEPGDDPTAPYYAEHQVASAMERRVADALGVDWAQYEQAIQACSKESTWRRP